jgi:hypothetical protein
MPELFVRVMVMVPGLTLRFRLKFEPELVPAPAPDVEADATVGLRFPNVPSVLAPESLFVPPFHWPQLPLVALVASDAEVAAATWVTVGLAEELKVSQPATSVAAEADVALATRVIDKAMVRSFMMRQ